MSEENLLSHAARNLIEASKIVTIFLKFQARQSEQIF